MSTIGGVWLNGAGTPGVAPDRICGARPEAAKGIEGTVLLDAVIDRDGAITDLSARTGHPWLAESAVEAVRHWRYRPTTVNGTPVEIQTEIEVTFALPDSVVSS